MNRTSSSNTRQTAQERNLMRPPLRAGAPVTDMSRVGFRYVTTTLKQATLQPDLRRS